MSITFTSHVKHRLGSWLLGTPESMNVPDDFYFEPCDRVKPHKDEISEPDIYLSRLATAWFRIDHTHRVTKLTSVLWTALLGVLLVPFGLYAGGHSLYVQHEATVAAAQAVKDQQIQARCIQQTPDQQKNDQACVDLAARQKAQAAEQAKAWRKQQCDNVAPENRAKSFYCQAQDQ
ncbi:MAG: hypothetical protein RSP_17820 [Rhodanobacter sp.]